MTAKSPVAVISDIHGNRWALEAVLGDIRRRGVNRIVNLGDVLYGPLDPRGTADLLMPVQIPTVLGNEDRMIISGTQEKPSPTLRFVQRELDERHREWLGGLPAVRVLDQSLFLCHGSPDSDRTYLLWDISPSGASRRSVADVQKALGQSGEPIVLCGHDHVPYAMRLPTGTVVVNPGSVGLPAYFDDTPYPHVMETGSPHARYTILHRIGMTWEIEPVMVPYDWETAAQCAAQNGRNDWAMWLRIGRAGLESGVHQSTR